MKIKKFVKDLVRRPKWSSAGFFPYYICTLVEDFAIYLIHIFRNYCKLIWQKQITTRKIIRLTYSTILYNKYINRYTALSLIDSPGLQHLDLLNIFLKTCFAHYVFCYKIQQGTCLFLPSR